MTEELLPCEHCPNSMVSTILGDVSLRWQVFCGRCGSSSGSCKTEDEAIKLWNTRSQPKYKRVDLETLYQNKCNCEGDNFPCMTCAHDFGWNEAIDEIKSKYGDLYAEVKE